MCHHSILSPVYNDEIYIYISLFGLVDFYSAGIVIHTTDAEAQAATVATTVDNDKSEKLVRQLPSDDSIKEVKMTQLDFQ